MVIFTRTVKETQLNSSDHAIATFRLQVVDKALKEKIIEIHEEYAALVVRGDFSFCRRSV